MVTPIDANELPDPQDSDLPDQIKPILVRTAILIGGETDGGKSESKQALTKLITGRRHLWSTLFFPSFTRFKILQVLLWLCPLE